MSEPMTVRVENLGACDVRVGEFVLRPGEVQTITYNGCFAVAFHVDNGPMVKYPGLKHEPDIQGDRNEGIQR